jgi:hypothetical protein
MCFGGISEIHAVLRREFGWRNFKLEFFWGLFEVPREVTEEGGPSSAFGRNFGQLRRFPRRRNCQGRGSLT